MSQFFIELPSCPIYFLKHHRAYCDIRVFNFLKAAVCKAEQCVAIDMLHKISPGEAELLKDPSYNARLRFRCAAARLLVVLLSHASFATHRFGGHSFPPYIVYKIFLSQPVKCVLYAALLFARPLHSCAVHCIFLVII